MSDSDDWNPRGVKKTKQSKKSAAIPSKAKKDPNAPKRPMSSYMLFVRENRKRLAEENPDCKQTQLMSLAGVAWKALDADEKSIYEAMNKKDKKRYEKEMSTYTPPKGMTAGGKRKKEKDPNAPKRPSTPYFAFMNHKRAEIKQENPDAGVADIGKIGGKMWGVLDDEEKQGYTDEYQAKMEVWREDMAAYTKSLGAKKAKKATAAEVPTSSDSE
jgi:high mobility group protein B2